MTFKKKHNISDYEKGGTTLIVCDLKEPTSTQSLFNECVMAGPC